MLKGTPRRTMLRAGAATAVSVLLGSRANKAIAQTDGGATPVPDMNEGTPTMESQSDQDVRKLWLSWVELWNGDFDVATELVSPDFVAHFPPTGPTPVELNGPEGITAGIQQFAGAFSEYTFTTTVGPIVDGDILAGRWNCRGLYNGAIPGSSPEMVGKEVAFEGADFLRVEGGQLVEYWLSADTLAYLQLIGIIPV